ncbi:hypothetical protein [Polaromonas glacialis]|uniref:hypothetical protein n=1 Tax=Polaromonas glacialis TaxID=866564 RepID=UPI001E4DDFF7|nr:hypothetical protein [Polaromonas glacialis]
MAKLETENLQGLPQLLQAAHLPALIGAEIYSLDVSFSFVLRLSKIATRPRQRFALDGARSNTIC